jgi:hypothetical protein
VVRHCVAVGGLLGHSHFRGESAVNKSEADLYATHLAIYAIKLTGFAYESCEYLSDRYHKNYARLV